MNGKKELAAAAVTSSMAAAMRKLTVGIPT